MDHSLFIYREGRTFLALLIYVDGLVLIGNSLEQCQFFEAYLHDYFKLKYLGSLKYLLGIEVAQPPKGLFLCRRKYAVDIRAEIGMLGARPAFFPMEQNHRLSQDTGRPFASAP